MRFCENETVEVYEATGASLADVLVDVAFQVRDHEGWVNLHTALFDGEYVVTAYMHA